MRACKVPSTYNTLFGLMYNDYLRTPAEHDNPARMYRNSGFNNGEILTVCSDSTGDDRDFILEHGISTVNLDGDNPLLLLHYTG